MSNPLVYQVNLQALFHALPLPNPTFDDIPDAWIQKIQEKGIAYLYLLGIWSTGLAGIEFSKKKLTQDYVIVSDASTIVSSPFAISNYTIKTEFGGKESFERFRTKLAAREISILVDFVPNHFARDHPWTITRPELFIQGTREELQQYPNDYFETTNSLVLAHGKDPNYPPWRDTVQLNYFRKETHQVMKEILFSIAEIADGIRCDMAMLVLSDVFLRTWGDQCHADLILDTFWKQVIPEVKEKFPQFIFIAEVYWDREYDLQLLGFDYTYDKKLYDRLVHNNPCEINAHLHADAEFQNKSCRMLENHDEPRAAQTFGDLSRYYAAAFICYTIPGMKLFHHGQFEGRRQFLSMHLGKRPYEEEDGNITALYSRLFRILNRDEAKYGTCIRASMAPSQDGNESFRSIVAYYLYYQQHCLLIVVNYSGCTSNGHIQFPYVINLKYERSIADKQVIFADLLSGETFIRCGTSLLGPGMWFHLKPWQLHVFEIIPMHNDEI